MSRSFAQIPSSRFDNDPVFRVLPPEAQITEVFLLTRPLNLCGRMLLRFKFWSTQTGVSEAELRRRVGLLVNARRVAIDEQTEELLVLGFPETDGVLRNPKLVIGMTTGFAEIDSPSLRSEFLHSLPEGIAMPQNGSDLTAQYLTRASQIPHRYPIEEVSQEPNSPPDNSSKTDRCPPGLITDERLDIADNNQKKSVAAEATPQAEPKPERARDLLFDALAVLAEGIPRERFSSLTKVQARAIGVAAAEIRKAGGDHTTVRAACAAYRQQFPGATLTANALAKHWARCQPSTGLSTQTESLEAIYARTNAGART